MSEGEGLQGIAPADAVPHAPWPAWRKVLAYVLLAALSLASIWIVDLKVHRAAQMPLSHPAGPP
jgi:hypothetical protein